MYTYMLGRGKPKILLKYEWKDSQALMVLFKFELFCPWTNNKSTLICGH